MLQELKQQLIKALYSAGVTGEIELVVPPKSEMGEFAFGCFTFAQKNRLSPPAVAKELSEGLQGAVGKIDMLEKVEANGPYVNFYLNNKLLAERVLNNIKPENKEKNGKKVLIEFAQPNTHKAFHIGHLRGTITGESLSRVMEAAGYDVVRANYQGDVGMHIAKCLWGILQIRNLKSEIRKLSSINEKIKFLGDAYVAGATAFESDEKIKKEIEEINNRIYGRDLEIKELYDETRAWSLEYFDGIYKKLDTHFDRFFFESEVYKRASQIVNEFLPKGVFAFSENAIIYRGENEGLHDRVFQTGAGNPTYEAKDLALAELQFKEFSPDQIIHVVAREQTEYFRVVFKVLEKTLPESLGKERHLPYGWVSLKSGKMSSRTGQVVLAESLMDEINKKVLGIMEKSEIKNKEAVAEKISLGALKYSFLKTGIGNDIVFDMEESVSLSGDSGPYLLYIVARINSILRKTGGGGLLAKLFGKTGGLPEKVEDREKQLLIKLAEFDGVVLKASEAKDPSKIAQYLFTLAQMFNNFYHISPILKADKKSKAFRIRIIKAVREVMASGLNLLGIETVEEM